MRAYYPYSRTRDSTTSGSTYCSPGKENIVMMFSKAPISSTTPLALDLANGSFDSSLGHVGLSSVQIIYRLIN